jgi:hypothetical protein
MSGDHLHCCPAGHTCDAEHSRCKKKFDVLTDIVCPDGMIDLFLLNRLIFVCIFQVYQRVRRV